MARTLTTQSPTGRIASLDGLRGIAILLVLMSHLVLSRIVPRQPRILMWGLGWVMRYGWSGVDLFFVLSGFLITGILLHSKGSAHYFKSFYMRRVLRIFPIYYLTLLTLLALEPLVAAGQPWLRALYPTPAGWLSHFLYYQNWWMPAHEPGKRILSNFWSLGVEEQFYLLWPACVLLAAPRRLKWICLGGSAFALTLRFAMASRGYSSDLILTSTATRADSLLIGAFLAIAVQDAVWLRRLKILCPYIFVSSFAFMAVIGHFGHEAWKRGYYTETIGYTCVACAYACVVFWAFLQNGTRTALDRVLNSSLLRIFGKYSYGLYVYHFAIFLVLTRMLSAYSWYGKRFFPSILTCAGFVGVTFAAAAFSFHFIETPFLSMKKNFKAEEPASQRYSTADARIPGAPISIQG
jgi:peptidoglycan/LPS O-acetylase OafA/YrhL